MTTSTAGATTTSARSADDAVADVGDPVGGDGPELLEPDRCHGRDLVEEPNAAAEQDRGDADLDLVESPGPQELLDGAGGAHGDILVPRRLQGQVEGAVDAFGHETHLRVPAALRGRVVRDDEVRCVDGVTVGPAPGDVERAASGDAGPGVLNPPLHDRDAGIGRAEEPVATVALGPRVHPGEQRLAALAHGCVEAVARPGDVAVQRHAQAHDDLAHGDPLAPERGPGRSRHGSVDGSWSPHDAGSRSLPEFWGWHPQSELVVLRRCRRPGTGRTPRRTVRR